MNIKNVSRFGIQRKIIANMTTQSWNEIPHVSYIYEPDVTLFYEKYKAFNAALPEGKKITINTVILKAITEAIKAAPQMNAHLEFNRSLVRGKITQYDNIDVSTPWILPSGQMMTLNLKDVGNRSLSNLHEYIADTGRKIKNTNLDEAMFSVSLHDTLEHLKHGHVIKVCLRLLGSKTGKHRVKTLSGKEKKEYENISVGDRLTRDDLKQGTITISNVGSITRNHPGTIGILMIIPPQVSVIGIGAMRKAPVIETNAAGEDEIKIAQILPLCVCFDHRALDFGEVKPFLDRLKEIFENPDELLKL